MTQNQIIYTSTLFELASLTSIIAGRSFTYVLLFFLFHTIASLLISTILITLIPKRYKYNKFLTISFFTLINSITFLIGYGISFYFVIFLLKRTKFEIYYKTETISLPSVLNYPIIKRTLGESALTEIDTATGMLKSRIINKLSTEISKVSINLFKKYTNDPDYEIRMFSFQKLSNIKNMIISQIKELIEYLEKNPNDFFSLKKVAILYWEIYSLGIGDNALNNFYISQTQKYIENAQKIAGDGELLFIKASILKDIKKYDEAIELLEKSLNYGANPHEVLPIIAEIYYNKGEYDKVKETLSRDQTLKYDLNTANLTDIWLIT